MRFRWVLVSALIRHLLGYVRNFDGWLTLTLLARFCRNGLQSLRWQRILAEMRTSHLLYLASHRTSGEMFTSSQAFSWHFHFIKSISHPNFENMAPFPFYPGLLLTSYWHYDPTNQCSIHFDDALLPSFSLLTSQLYHFWPHILSRLLDSLLLGMSAHESLVVFFTVWRIPLESDWSGLLSLIHPSPCPSPLYESFILVLRAKISLM